MDIDKVYIVASGEYSSYGVRAVFKNRKDAETVAAAWEYGEVLEMGFGTIQGSAPVWEISFDKNGAVEDGPYKSYEEDDTKYPWCFDDGSEVYVRALTADKAKKIAIDYRIKFLAEQAGI